MDSILPQELLPREAGSHFYPDSHDWSLNFTFTGKGSICPSGVCKGIVDDSTTGLLLSVEPTYIRFWGNFRLLDNDSNNKFTPIKRALVENIHAESWCNLIDVKEDQLKNATTYICGKNTDDISLSRTINDTSYDFGNYKMSFELPSRHLKINATEKE